MNVKILLILTLFNFFSFEKFNVFEVLSNLEGSNEELLDLLKVVEDSNNEKLVQITKSSYLIFDTVESLDFDTIQYLEKVKGTMFWEENLNNSNAFRDAYEAFYISKLMDSFYSDTIEIINERIASVIFDTELFLSLYKKPNAKKYFNFQNETVYRCLIQPSARQYLVMKYIDYGLMREMRVIFLEKENIREEFKVISDFNSVILF